MAWFDGWIALAGGGVALALAVAWFFPPFRKVAIAIALGVAGAAFIRQKGLNDGSRKKQAEWDSAERNMVEKSNSARADAQRRADAGKLPDDEFDRDKGQVRRP